MLALMGYGEGEVGQDVKESPTGSGGWSISGSHPTASIMPNERALGV